MTKKKSAASQGFKLLFLLLLGNNLNIESFPYSDMADIVSHPPNASIKVNYFGISPKVLAICQTSRTDSIYLRVPSLFILKLILEISRNSQQNTFDKVSFLMKLQAEACNFIKKGTLAQVFSCNFAKFLKHLFLQNQTTCSFYFSYDVVPHISQYY